MAKILLVGNYKGGVGKTVSSIMIGSVLARNYKVLLIDLDPQSSLSEICFRNIGKELFNVDYDKEYSRFINYIYFKSLSSMNFQPFSSSFNCLNLDFFIEPYVIYNNKSELSFIPNSLFYCMNGYESLGLDDLCMEMGNNDAFLLSLPLLLKTNRFNEKYDFIIIDTPPSSNIITQSAFLTSEYLIIPTIMDPISIKGISHYWKKINDTIDKYYGKNNKNYLLFNEIFGNKIEFLGVFETMRERNKTNNEDSLRTQILQEGKYNLLKSVIKQIDEVVDYSYKIKYNILSDMNIGEGEGMPFLIKGYNELAKEILEVMK